MDEARETTQRLLRGQGVGVLCTQRAGEVHASLVCVVAADDLKSIVFVTPKATRKYENMLRDSRVALLVHDVACAEGRLCCAAAVTATGRAVEVRGDERAALATVYLARHEELRGFLESPDSALMRMSVDVYRVALNVKDVVEFRPPV